MWNWFEQRREFGMFFVRLIVGFHLIHGTADNVFFFIRPAAAVMIVNFLCALLIAHRSGGISAGVGGPVHALLVDRVPHSRSGTAGALHGSTAR